MVLNHLDAQKGQGGRGQSGNVVATPATTDRTTIVTQLEEIKAREEGQEGKGGIGPREGDEGDVVLLDERVKEPRRRDEMIPAWPTRRRCRGFGRPFGPCAMGDEPLAGP